MVAGLSVIVDNHVDGVVGKVSWVGDVEDQLLVPVRIEVFGFGLCSLSLLVEVDLHKGRCEPVAVLGHEVTCIVNFDYELDHGEW